MIEPIPMRRNLRPRYVFFANDTVWVVDETQPVAALFDPRTGEPRGLVSWADLPQAPANSGQPEIVADATGLWVQNHRDGPLVHVGTEGIDRAEFTEGGRLICAGPGGAWCLPQVRRRRDVASTVDCPPRPVLSRPTLLVATPAGGMSRVEVDATAIVSVEFDGSSLFVGVEHEPWTRKPVHAESPGARTGFELRYQSSVLQVPLNATIPRRIGPATHPCLMRRSVEYTSEYADQSYNEAHRRKRAFDGELRWYWGVDRHPGARTVVRAYDDGGSSDPVTAFELPGVRVAHGAAGAGRLWLVATPEPFTGSGRAVLAADVSGEVRSLPTSGVDITDRCWPLALEPLDHDAYVRYCLRGLDGVRFSDKVDEVIAVYVGRWPQGRIHVRFRHCDYPNVVLVARLNLYDEQGIRLERFLGYVRPELMEQAGTRRLPAGLGGR